MQTNSQSSAPPVTSTQGAIPPKVLYTLYYRQGSNPHPQFTSFFMSSVDMQQVTQRAKRHCEVMNYRFVYVRPAIIDLDKEENFLDQAR